LRYSCLLDGYPPSQTGHLKEEMLTKMETHHERMMARMDSQLEKMEVCLGKAEAMNLEGNPEEKQSKAEHEEVPKEEATVKTVRALKKRHGDWHLDVRHHGQLKKWTQDNGGSRKKLTATCRGMTCCTISARHKGHCYQG
jgi:hypothetical protein